MSKRPWVPPDAPLTLHPSESSYQRCLQPSVAARKLEKGWLHGERKRMLIEDDRACAQRTIRDVMPKLDSTMAEVEQLLACASSSSSAAPPPPPEPPAPLFRPGQSVLHWWASWMQDDALPSQHGKKKRPAWYSAEIVEHGLLLRRGGS